MHPDNGGVYQFGPFVLDHDYEDVLEVRFFAPVLAVEPAIVSYVTGRVSADERKYIEGRLGEPGVKSLEEHAPLRRVKGTGAMARLYEFPDEVVGVVPDTVICAFGLTVDEVMTGLRERIEAYAQVEGEYLSNDLRQAREYSLSVL